MDNEAPISDPIMATIAPSVLRVVVENSVLDLGTINHNIRCLSKEFRTIADAALEEHEGYHRGLKIVNADFKFHYCSLCGKPHVPDGSWREELCSCVLHATEHVMEINRRMRLGVVRDPRMDPTFTTLSTKVKAIRLTKFVSGFCQYAMDVALSCACVRVLPAVSLSFLPYQWNETGFDFLFHCTLVNYLRKEFCSLSPRSTMLLDVVLEVAGAVETGQRTENYYNDLLGDLSACLEHFTGEHCPIPLIDTLGFEVSKSLFDVLYYHFSQEGREAGDVIMNDVFKNLGNSIGKFLTDPKKHASMYLKKADYETMLRRLPETFVWMPVYGGDRDDYVPPENLFARYAAQDD